MIKASEGEIQVEGSKAEILADFACIARTLMMDLKVPVEEIEKSVKLAQKTGEELTDMLLEKLLEAATKL